MINGISRSATKTVQGSQRRMSEVLDRPILGTLTPIFVAHSKPPPVPMISREKGYFLIRIHAAQASYVGTPWSRFRNAAKQVIVTSEVQLKPWIEEPLQQIQVARRMRPKQVVQLGLRSNLIDLIPATVEKVSVKLSIILDQKDRLQSLSDAINSSGFLSTISLSEPTLATAKALGKASRCVLDAFLEAETRKPILEFTGDFNVGMEDLRAGYYILLGTSDKATSLRPGGGRYTVKETELLLDGEPIQQWSYVILEVLCAEARDRNRQAKWDKLLRDAQAEADTFARGSDATDARRKAALEKCQTLVTQADALLRADANYLPEEARNIVAAAFKRCGDTIRGSGSSRGLGLPVVREADQWISDTRHRLGLPEDTALVQDLRRYATQLRAYRSTEQERAEKDGRSEILRQLVEESDRKLVAMQQDARRGLQ
jgi:hypothetical protein